MKKFLIRILLFGTLPLVALALLLMIVDREFIPAPMVTNSYSLNEKIFSISKKEAPYLAIGSSITLNNLNSDAVTNSLGSTDYINLAAWGMKMEDIYPLARAFFREYKPAVVFMASNVDDFCYSKIKFEEQDIVSTLNDHNRFWMYARNFNPPYYYKRYFENKIKKERRDIYDSIQFDDFGGVPLSAEGFTIDSLRWDKSIPVDLIDEKNYDYLDSLCQLVSTYKADLVFLQSPNREGLVLEKKAADKMTAHIKHVAGIINKYGHFFIDSSDTAWPDSLFLDYGHMNESGAQFFTNYCLEQWRSQKVSYFD